MKNASRTKELLRNVRRVEIKTKRLVDGLLQGAYHSVFKGRGIEFSDVREYVVGDDIRNIDWKVTARFNVPYVKEFVEERDLTLYILFDISASGLFGSTREKRYIAAEIAASLMFAALRNNDNVGLCLFTDRVELFFKPRKGRKHVMRLIRDMLYYEPLHRGTSLSNAMMFISKLTKRRCIVFIISDFLSNEDFEKPLRLLRHRHDVIAICLRDVREVELPDVGYVEIEDEETGEQMLIDTSDPDFRKEYARIMIERDKSIAEVMKRCKVDFIKIFTHERFEVPIKRFFMLREKRIR
ncbi:MAG TPA: DUF58 domain-containing protein [Candidatus Aenigmarchaeota archaeon]|nr:MAG: DUF58 domain-containing protein [Candidatus Aenigmarchaeota archaeon]HDD46039.1 DUF58 domain-containing protein [Candidatus Aenigmarchaeota archaeon]